MLKRAVTDSSLPSVNEHVGELPERRRPSRGWSRQNAGSGAIDAATGARWCSGRPITRPIYLLGRLPPPLLTLAPTSFTKLMHFPRFRTCSSAVVSLTLLAGLLSAPSGLAQATGACREAGASVPALERLAHRRHDAVTQRLCVNLQRRPDSVLALAWRSRRKAGWIIGLHGAHGWRIALSRAASARVVILKTEKTALVITEELSSVLVHGAHCQRELVTRYRLTGDMRHALGTPRRRTACPMRRHGHGAGETEVGASGAGGSSGTAPTPLVTGRAALGDTLTCHAAWNGSVTETGYAWERG